jgi:hypothetical protein
VGEERERWVLGVVVSRRLGTLAALVILAAHGSCASTREITPEAVSGCYQLQLTAWQPAFPLGGDAEFVTPPDRMNLTLDKPEHPWRKGSFVVRPAPGSRDTIHTSGEWVLSDEKLEILWTTGFSGLTVDLSPTRHGFQGIARTFWDFPRATQTAGVEATRASCGE